MIHEQYEAEEKLKEECGVFGMYDFDGGDVASAIYYGLFALQHRGQESCGIAVSDTRGPKGIVKSHKGMGLVNEVFTPDVLKGRYRAWSYALFYCGQQHTGKCAAARAELYQRNPGIGA